MGGITTSYDLHLTTDVQVSSSEYAVTFVSQLPVYLLIVLQSPIQLLKLSEIFLQCLYSTCTKFNLESIHLIGKLPFKNRKILSVKILAIFSKQYHYFQFGLQLIFYIRFVKPSFLNFHKLILGFHVTSILIT